MRWRSPLGALLFIAAMPLALSGVFEAIGSLALLAIGIGAGSALIPGFWPRLLHGAVGGVVAGLFVLGPGLRLAMPIVSPPAFPKTLLVRATRSRRANTCRPWSAIASYSSRPTSPSASRPMRS